MAVTADESRAIADAVLDEASALHARMRTLDLAPLVAAAHAIRRACEGDHRVLVCGNGGSAAEAQHFAAELAGRFTRVRRALPAIALTTDTSVLTAVANDLGFDHVFARQVEALGRPGDVLVAISTSGASTNVLRAVDTARRRGLVTIALTGGDGGRLGAAAAVHVNVPHPVTARVQEVQLTLLHVLCELVEREMPEDIE